MTVREFINKQNWRFATSYAAFAPHEYIVRNRCNAEEFDRFGEYILEHGMKAFYYKAERKYLFFDGWFYWIMRSEENPADAVINRCKPEDYDVVFIRRNTWNKEKYEQYKLPLDKMM